MLQWQYIYVAMATWRCAMNEILEAIFRRRAIRAFDPVEIPREVREQILEAARVAPSSFNVQPYRFYWVETPEMKTRAARLCMGQAAAETLRRWPWRWRISGRGERRHKANWNGCGKRGSAKSKSPNSRKKQSWRNGFSCRGGLGFSGVEMGDPEGGPFVEDHRHRAGGAARPL